MKINKTLILIAILVLAGVLRLWKLDSIPPHLTPDEASLGYNAYSILKTGRDEYGQFFPVIFKSFGDYKPGLYVYLTVPFVATLGLNEFAVRLPSAVAGVFSVYLIYLIIKNLRIGNSLKTENLKLGIVAMFVAATNPWLIYFSRGAWEANVSLALTLAGVYFFLRSFRKSIFLLPSSIFFSLTLLAYQGAKLSTGIVVLVLGVLYLNEVLNFNEKHLFLGILISVLISLPMVLSLFQGKAGRLEIFSVFSYARPKEYLENFLVQGNERVGDLSYSFFHSETLNFAKGILGRWFNHFSGKFLFFEGDWQNPRHSAPNSGMLLLGDIVILLYGFIVILKNKISKGTVFILLWLVLAPLPAILSRDQIHAVRSLNMSIPLIFIAAVGLNILISRGVNTIPRRVWDRFARRGILGTLALLYILGVVYFFDAYFIHLPKHNPQSWYWGYKQMVEAVSSIQSKYKRVKIQQSFAQPYIYFLFFRRYDPARYQKRAKLVESEYRGDVGYVAKLDNIEFVQIDWPLNRGEHGTLFVADPIKIPPEDSSDSNLFRLIKEIKYLNGRDTAFRIVEVK